MGAGPGVDQGGGVGLLSVAWQRRGHVEEGGKRPVPDLLVCNGVEPTSYTLALWLLGF